VIEDKRDAEARRRRAEGDRVRAVREAYGELQPAFAARLNAAARHLGMNWLNYTNFIVSRLETGDRMMFLDDAVVIASVDPEQRGRVWVAWDDEREVIAQTPAQRMLKEHGQEDLHQVPMTPAEVNAMVERSKGPTRKVGNSKKRR